MIKRIVPDRCWAAIIDVQEFFLSAMGERRRSRVETDIANFARLLGYFRIPILVTLERPLSRKGSVPKGIKRHLDGRAKFFEKDFFDLTREKTIRDYLPRMKKKQVILAGCETDVCVLQSCLGLLELDYEVYVVEDLVFSASRNVAAAIARMQSAGAVFLTYKTLYYELTAAVDGGEHGDAITARFGPFPDDLSDTAES
jgi:nicotinamidase-related amidase